MDDRLRFDTQGTILLVAALLSTSLFALLVSNLPVAILAGAGHDDAWFWRHAHSIVSGHWLGGYDQFTLMKGAGYPLFLALNSLTGMSVSLSQALLYSSGCALVALGAWRMSGRPWLALLLFVAMQWHPMALSWDRVIRDNIYAAQTLLTLGCLLQFLFVARSPAARLAWAATSGVMLAWLWSTREDGVWILPGIAILVAAAWLPLRHERHGWPRHLAAGTAMAVCFAGFLALIATANWAKYGKFELVDLKGASYAEAVSALQRVRVGEPVPYVPVPEKVRMAIYPVSPTFARLQPYLEEAGRHWHVPGCSTYAGTCGDYAGGWFLWALRDGVAALGGYASPLAADAFYRSIASEVHAACESGRLACVRGSVSLMPAVTRGQWATFPRRLGEAASLLVWRDVRAPRLNSHARLAAAGEMWSFVGKPKVPDSPDAIGDWVVGWFHAPEGTWLRMRCPSGEAHGIARRPSPDIAAHFDDPAARDRRFEFKAPSEGGCVLEITSGADVAAAVDFSAVAAGARHFDLDAGQLHFDSAEGGIAPTAQAPAVAGIARQGVGRVYAVVLPFVSAAGLLAFGWATALSVRRRRLKPLFALAMAAWSLVASRIVLLALVDVSSFPAINVQYMQPVFPLLVLAAMLSIVAAFDRDTPA